MSVVNRASAPHYHWGGTCDGWHLLDVPDLSVIEERMPPGASETCHRHLRARQFFRVLDGEAVLELDGTAHVLRAGDGLHVPPGAAHQMRNASMADVRFLVVSSPHSHGDRYAATEEFPQ
ncbi:MULTISPECIES: cupin domain-containing protein [Xanthomonas]|uniref:Cupin n=1 Tax=Xanthomonas cucurbitae TaxID=56453 RepID=A0A2S7DSM0_9XANT|nr:cupin domain-containing protein [Xanthomonas cucurbitae]PPU76760.1 cupin [Xanthomonas cucurbitae]QHG87324.1 cupin domain-containing protein [Xanthomonas cucurbitae]WDM69572.1 cupin domain-containing protein [Xanthomonas cucurbitae]WDM73447.1 cupin domain-containing protein [Xanthomonas cucurbitae]WDM73911.1 cupin domain-containing protein [Xanthomonas cucurbitae]